MLRVAIAGAGISGSILAAQLSKHANVRVTLLERFARGALPPGLNLLLNHNGMAALGALDARLAEAVRRVGEPMVSWSAATLSGRPLYGLGDVTAAGAASAVGGERSGPLADTYGVRGRWRDLTATCQLAAVASAAEIRWRTQVAGVRCSSGGARGSRAPLTLTLHRAAEIAGGIGTYTNQEALGSGNAGSPAVAAAAAAEAEAAAWADARAEELEVDLLVGCDGRYSSVRKASVDAEDELVSYGPPFVSDFRLVAPISEHDAAAFFGSADAQDLRRLYNVPRADNLRRLVSAAELARPENAAFATHCMSGLARVGVMTIAPSRLDAWGDVLPQAAAPGAAGGSGTGEQLFVGFFGNFRLPEGSNEPIPPVAKTAAGLRALYTPAGGEAELDLLGRFVLKTLTENAEQVHWTRMQATPQRVLPGVCRGAGGGAPSAAAGPPPSASARFGGRVLLLGDAAGAMYPALGQGANQAIEDACAAAHVLGAACSLAASRGDGGVVDVPSAADAIWTLRQPRREFVAGFSRQHAEHIARADGGASLQAEAADWTGASGGRFDGLPGEGTGAWRRGLHRLWSGWQRPRECIQAFERARQCRGTASLARAAPLGAGAGTGHGGAPLAMQHRSFSRASPAVKLAATATRESFAPFGDLVSPAPDGQGWSADMDAALDGFDGSQGLPRLYLLELRGPRPLRFDRITHHARVTQCLGAASATEDFYLAVHAPTAAGPDGAASPPDPSEVRVFRVAPLTFVKLHRGTWHAGPLWGDAPRRVFFNLELHDTNEVDHNTVALDRTYVFEPCA